MAEQKRIIWQDAARGLAILSVALGHIVEKSPYRGFTEPVHHVLYSFHMALFFILSGMLFKVKDGETWGKFIKKRAKSILLPYAVFLVLIMLWFGLVEHYYPLLEWWQLYHILLMCRGSAVQYFWFIPAIFTTQVLYFPMAKHIKSDVVRGLICIPAAAVGLIIGWWLDPWNMLPFYIDTALFSLLFLYIGHMLKKHEKLFKALTAGVPSLVVEAVVFIAANLYSILVLKARSSFYFNLDIGHPLIAYLTYISGSLLFIRLARIPAITNRKTLQWFGENSLYVFGLHYFVLWAIGYNIGNWLLSEASPWYIALPVVILQFAVTVVLTAGAVKLYLWVKKKVFGRARQKSSKA